MKNVNKYLSIILVMVVCQLIVVNIFAQQTTIEKETRTKCERCAEYLSTNNMTDYAAENCRIYGMVCNQLENEPIVVSKSEETKQLKLNTGTQQSLMIFIDGFSKVSYDVTPKVTILNEAKEEVASIETNVFKQYKIDGNGNFNMKGIMKIKKLSDEKRILITDIEIPEIEEKNIYIQVEFLYSNPLNQQNEVVEKIMTQFEVQ